MIVQMTRHTHRSISLPRCFCHVYKYNGMEWNKFLNLQNCHAGMKQWMSSFCHLHRNIAKVKLSNLTNDLEKRIHTISSFD